VKILAEQAKEYFADASQRTSGLSVDDLTDVGFHYYADGMVCGVAHYGMHPDVWMMHYAVKPEGKGRYDKRIVRLLAEAWDDLGAKLIIGWTPEHNRLALALARRVGFRVTGYLDLAERVVMQEWKPEYMEGN